MKSNKHQAGVERLMKVNSEEDLENIIAGEYGEAYTSYRSLWNSTNRSSLLDFPIHIDFELNDKCNQACIMCPRNADTHPNSGYALNRKSSLTLDIFEKVLKECRLYNLKSINLGAFAEPLIHPDFFRFIELAHSYGFLILSLPMPFFLMKKHPESLSLQK